MVAFNHAHFLVMANPAITSFHFDKMDSEFAQ